MNAKAAKRKKVVVHGIAGYGATIREAREDALERIGKVLERLRGDCVPRIVAWRGFVGIAYMDVHGVNCALIADPEKGVRVGKLWTHMMLQEGAIMEDAERAVRSHVAQLGWRIEDGLRPPEILRDDRDRDAFRDWARWQSVFAETVAGGASSETARAAADGAF